MKSGKAVGPEDILVEVWKCLGEAAVEFLTSLFNRVLENLEKAYDRVPREELWYCMRKSGVADKYVRVVQDMYERSRTVVLVLFAMVMDQLSEEVEENLERWRFVLERRGMKVSRSKTEYMCVNETEGSGTGIGSSVDHAEGPGSIPSQCLNPSHWMQCRSQARKNGRVASGRASGAKHLPSCCADQLVRCGDPEQEAAESNFLFFVTLDFFTVIRDDA
ncbi:hypothetical protein QTP70_007517 [Hemibagrus guttatus]|uniref:Uncharacterized protein n=1 Tax=Hemibagrus guttatus TaxID=175788 RepID=A0AAE0QLS6_9TELE|nr:hypothetical protein QTP70_007517 [Hemibagrus guttatus]